MQKISFLVLGAILFALPGTTLAQDSGEAATGQSASQNSSGRLSCFDYYKFGSVQADLQPNLHQTVPGVTLSFSGNVTNENDYPLVEGKLSAKIFRRDQGTFDKGNGNPVVDQFVIEENIQLGAKASKNVSFDWKVPTNARGGEYYVAYFFTTSERYNLMGLSFTDDVVGNQAQFTVTSDSAPQNVEFDKNTTFLNDRGVQIVAFAPHFNGKEPVDVKVSLTNPSDQVKTLPLQWNQYNWDAQRAENRKNTRTELITLQPKETKQFQYTNLPTDGVVNYITAVVQDGDQKSFFNTRYVKDGIAETRINFPSITSFPLKADQEQTLFACAHSTNVPTVKGNTLLLTLKDREGGVISQYRYEGDIYGKMGGYGQKFTPTKDYDYVTLEASLFREGNEMEKIEVIYDCSVLDPSKCSSPKEEDQSFVYGLSGRNLVIAGIAALGILVLIGGLIVNHRRQKTVQW